MKIIKNLLVILSLIICSSAFASPGKLNKDGCHTSKKTGKYHCHSKSEKKADKKEKVSDKKAENSEKKDK